MGANSSAPVVQEAQAAAATPKSKLVLPMHYGMYVMSLENFLSMEGLPPHQQLKREGKLMEWTEDLDRPVLFLSHQWLSFKHPDPLLEQVRTFQELLQELKTGNMDVPLAVLHKCWMKAGVETCLPGTHWKEVLPKAMVWMDYFSMPQPTVIDEENVVANGSDSRHLSTDLEKAVRSIPAYVENSEYFFVLAPPAKHKDLTEISDRVSWASRGWCRMEAQARALSTRGGPVIMVQGAKSAEMMIPAEWYRTPVGEGVFTCCKLGHKLPTPNGVIEIPCDKVKVATVLETMYDNKVKTLAEQEDLLEWRWLRARRQTLFAGLPHDYAQRESQTLEEFLEEYKFASVNDGEESGGSPLRFAVIRRDAALAEALVAAGANVDCKVQEDMPLLYHNEGQTMLHTAGIFGNLSVIKPLIEAGADLTPTVGG
jgi:hypothetical protein